MKYWLILFLLTGCVPINKGKLASPPATSAPQNKWLQDNNDSDSDGDGLSDFDEIHKYFTDPLQADTDGDGVPDGDWHERREYTYSIRIVIDILKPFDIAAMNNDYQDARLISDNGTYGRVEVISYPLNTVAQAMRADKDWRSSVANLSKYTASTKTSDWTPAMRDEIYRLLAAKGMAKSSVDTIDDKTLVEILSQLIFAPGYRVFEDGAPFSAYYVDFPSFRMNSMFETVFSTELINKGFAFNDEAARLGALGSALFVKKTFGSCTPSAILQSSIMRAMSIPSRIVVHVPIIDPNSERQRSLVAGIHHHKVRSIVEDGLLSTGGWISHTFNEVYVGGRWRHLNYLNLGQNVLDKDFFGIMIRVNNLVDWSEGGYTNTYGARQAEYMKAGSYEKLDPPFESRNPYMTVELSDLFGSHAKISNDPLPPRLEHQALTLMGVYRENDPGVKTFSDMLHGSAPSLCDVLGGSPCLVAKVQETFPNQGYKQYSAFRDSVNLGPFTLKGADGSVINAYMPSAIFSFPERQDNGDVLERAVFSLKFDSSELAKLKEGVRYTITPPPPSASGKVWKVAPGVVAIKP